MIRPIHNLQSLFALEYGYSFPPIRFLKRSLLARKCAALIRADRYLEEKDK